MTHTYIIIYDVQHCTELPHSVQQEVHTALTFRSMLSLSSLAVGTAVTTNMKNRSTASRHATMSTRKGEVISYGVAGGGGGGGGGGRGKGSKQQYQSCEAPLHCLLVAGGACNSSVTSI